MYPLISNRVVLAMDKPGPMTSPFAIPIEQAGRGRCQSLASIGSKTNVSHFLHKSIKVVFGRDPFSRIFSAFIDKLFSPNPFYWSYWGEKVLKLHKVKTIGKACASEITFQQFLRLVLYDLHKNDVHLRQVYDECRMCDVIYDIAGKLETTEEDLDYLLAKLNVSSSFQHEESYSVDSKMDIIYDSVKSTFSWKKDISRCISLDQMALRIWRKLQIRGVIDSSISYPFRPGDIDNMSASKFIEACKSAVLKSTDKNQLKKQKSQAFLEAYKSVNEKDLLAVGRVYKDDFAMFGYNPKPASIFENRDKIRFTGSLNWRADWIL